MAFFGRNWLEDYDSIKEYESHIGRSSIGTIDYDRPIGAPCSTDDEYYPHDDDSGGIKHFSD